MRPSHPRASVRTLAALLALVQSLLGCPVPNPPLAPVVGLAERRERNLVAVPGGFVDVAGGKLLVRRSDLELDTKLGRESLGAVYDSASRRWHWSFESRYDGATFVDESGASFAVASLPDGAAIPGTYWVKLDATRIETKGGLVHAYGAGGLLAARYWSSDPYPRIQQRSANVAGVLRITSIEQCTSASLCSPLFTLGYDAAGQLVSLLDRAGRRAEFGWDGSGQLVSARDGLDVERGWPGFRYAYSAGRLTSLANSEGERITYEYKGSAVTSVTQAGPPGLVQRFQYEGRDGTGIHHTRFWNPLGEERRYAYDTLGRLLEQRDVATGETTRWAWSGERCVAEVLPNGARTSWSYRDDDVETRSDPSGNLVTFLHQPGGVDREHPRRRALARVSDTLGLVEQRSYDAAGRLLELRNGEGEGASFGWAQGALASETRQGITRSFSQYGEHGHAERIHGPGGDELRVFDAVGNLVQGGGMGPVAGGIERRDFDADRNLAALTLRPQGGAGGAQTITLEYRSDGQRTRVLRGGDDHEFVYDGFGRMVEQRERADGVWRSTRFGYDAASRLSSVERPNGMREELAFGPAGRIASVAWLRGGDLESTLAFTYRDGELVLIDDSQSGVERYEYDAAGRPVSTTFAGGERIDTGYDLRSRVTDEAFVGPQGGLLTTLRYEHDLADRRVRISDASGELWAARHADGRLSELRYGNGLVRSFSHRPDGIPDGAITHAADGAVLESTTLDTELVLDDDVVYRIRQRATTATFGTVDVTTVEDYELLPVPDGSPGSAAGPRIATWNDGLGADEDYVFDARSNLLAMGETRFEYNAEGNRLLGVSRAGVPVGSYDYDAAGFATSRNGEVLRWNAAGRLVAHGSDRLAWDGLGRLRSAQVGGVSASFAFGGRAPSDAAGRPIAIDLGEVMVGLSGAHRYRHFDFRDNVKFVSDDAGEVIAHYRYTPFGLDAVFGSDADPVRFAGRPEVGELMLLGVRVYDPAVGRFLSPDPLFQIVNQYAYTLGNPIWFSDADGLSAASNESAEAIADGLGLAGGTLGLIGQLLRFSPTPQTVIIGSGLSLLGAILVLLGAFIRTSSKAAASFGLSGLSAPSGGGSGGGGGTGSGTGSGGCSPAGLARLPDLPGWLRLLLPLQLLLGWLELRRRRRRAGSLS